MSEDRISFVSCDYTNKDSIVLTDRHGNVREHYDADQYDVIGLYHSDGPEAAADWIHCNQELVADLQENVFNTVDIALGPAESDFLEAEDAPAEETPCGASCSGDCSAEPCPDNNPELEEAVKSEASAEPESGSDDPDGDLTLGDDVEMATADIDGDPDLDGLDEDDEE